MSEVEKFTLEEAHQAFAKQFNGRVWKLLGQPERSREDDEEMEIAAIASLYHWLQVGTALHRQRGEWMLAHVYTVLGRADPALRHAERCLELTQAHSAEMKDFDFAYGYEGIARAKALGGDRAQAKKYFDLAQAAGEKIQDAEDKEIFTGDLAGGEWYGLI